MTSAQELLRDIFGSLPDFAERSLSLQPFPIAYDGLASVPGWVVWLGHPPVPSGLPLAPLPDELIWGEPAQALAASAVVLTDYATQRGAATPADFDRLMRRESPIVFATPSGVHPLIRNLVDLFHSSGVPVSDSIESRDDLAGKAIPAKNRDSAHKTAIRRPHDPALSFQAFEEIDRIGGNSLSSFVVHNEGERDQVHVTGDLSARFGLEVGLKFPGITLESTETIEAEIAQMPSFLDGVASRVNGHSLEIGWVDGKVPTGEAIGEAIRAWARVFYTAPIVDVRLVFAPPKGRSAVLTDMRARAAAFHEYRAAVIAGDPNPLGGIDTEIESTGV